MVKPPKATPHSDIDGVHQDERKNTDTANDLGQSGADLEPTKSLSIGHPEYVDDKKNRDDRST